MPALAATSHLSAATSRVSSAGAVIFDGPGSTAADWRQRRAAAIVGNVFRNGFPSRADQTWPW